MLKRSNLIQCLFSLLFRAKFDRWEYYKTLSSELWKKARSFRLYVIFANKAEAYPRGVIYNAVAEFTTLQFIVTYESAQYARVLHYTWLERPSRTNTLAYLSLS
jgi:hypothetical protein